MSIAQRIGKAVQVALNYLVVATESVVGAADYVADNKDEIIATANEVAAILADMANVLIKITGDDITKVVPALIQVCQHVLLAYKVIQRRWAVNVVA